LFFSGIILLSIIFATNAFPPCVRCSSIDQIAGQFFMEEDFELALLKEEQCPFSRTGAANVVDYGHL
jgi:hypothetical protein